MAHYIALIHKDAGSEYGVSFPDFPGCVSAGATLDEARQMIASALLDLAGLSLDRAEQIDQRFDDEQTRLQGLLAGLGDAAAAVAGAVLA